MINSEKLTGGLLLNYSYAPTVIEFSLGTCLPRISKLVLPRSFQSKWAVDSIKLEISLTLFSLQQYAAIKLF